MLNNLLIGSNPNFSTQNIIGQIKLYFYVDNFLCFIYKISKVQYRQPAEQHVWVASPAVVPPPADSVNKPRTVRKFFFNQLRNFLTLC